MHIFTANGSEGGGGGGRGPKILQNRYRVIQCMCREKRKSDNLKRSHYILLECCISESVH